MKQKKVFDQVSRGLTLIELLVVIAILGILAAGILALLNPVSQLQKARDARRKSDLSEIQKALELYYQDCGYYPANFPPAPGADYYRFDSKCQGDPSLKEITFGQNMPLYMSQVPNDPRGVPDGSRDNDWHYQYVQLDAGQGYCVY